MLQPWLPCSPSSLLPVSDAGTLCSPPHWRLASLPSSSLCCQYDRSGLCKTCLIARCPRTYLSFRLCIPDRFACGLELTPRQPKRHRGRWWSSRCSQRVESLNLTCLVYRPRIDHHIFSTPLIHRSTRFADGCTATATKRLMADARPALKEHGPWQGPVQRAQSNECARGSKDKIKIRALASQNPCDLIEAQIRNPPLVHTSATDRHHEIPPAHQMHRGRRSSSDPSAPGSRAPEKAA